MYFLSGLYNDGQNLCPTITGQNKGKARQGKARQVYLYSTFHTQWQFKVLYIEEIKKL